MANITNVLTNPDRFFSEQSARETNLKVSFLIVLLVAIINAIDSVIIFNALTSKPPDYAAQFIGISTAIIAIKSLAGPFIEWTFYAGIFYIISTLFKGEGSFKRLLEFVGYGFILTIIMQLIGLAVTMIVLPTMIELPTFESWFENPEPLKQMLKQNQLIVVSSIISILLMLWSAYIWIFGIKHARNISTKHAMLTVGVPVGIGLILIIILRFFS